MAIVTFGVGLLLVGHRAPFVVFNATASAPIGFYRVLSPQPLTRGDLVLVRTPEAVRALAAERGYIPPTVALVKRIVALHGQTVCAGDRTLTVDGRHVADRLYFDREGRPLPAWVGCRELTADELFLLMADVPDSFDSRYFGPVSASAVIGRLSPLWTR